MLGMTVFVCEYKRISKMLVLVTLIGHNLSVVITITQQAHSLLVRHRTYYVSYLQLDESFTQIESYRPVKAVLES
jgi:hypothetical protein